MIHSEVISINQKEKWIELVERTAYKDIHFLPTYLSLLGNHISASCHMYYYGTDNCYILYPFYKRKINDLFPHEKTDKVYWDIISPWYYGGPLFYGDIRKDHLSNFVTEFQKYCKEENIVSEFARFNPYLSNHEQMTSLLNLKKIGTTVWIDLTENLDSINESFTKMCRSNIRRKKEDCTFFHSSNEDKYLRIFHRLYLKAMYEKKASDFYYFTYAFLNDLKRHFSKHFTLITVVYRDNIVAGSIYLHKYGRMYAYLSARDPKHDRVKAANKIIFEAIKYGKNIGCELLDLGGGPRGSGLLAFKKGFSDKTKTLYGIKNIYDKEKYLKVCKIAGLDKNEIEYENASFFPEYRR